MMVAIELSSNESVHRLCSSLNASQRLCPNAFFTQRERSAFLLSNIR